MLTEKPPYPYSIVGLLPSSDKFFFAVRKNGTRVPSFEVAKSAFVSNRLVSTGGAACSKGMLLFVPGSNLCTDTGVRGELKLYQISDESCRPAIPPTAPGPGSTTSPCVVPFSPNKDSWLCT